MKQAGYLAFLLVIGVIFVVLTNLAFADWQACFNEASAKPLSLRLLFPRNPEEFWLFYLPVLPLAALAIGTPNPDLRAWIAAGVLLTAGLWLMLPSEAMHDCDRKGSDADFVPLSLVPFAFLLMLFVIARRGQAKKTRK